MTKEVNETKKKAKEKETQVAMIPYIVHEDEMHRHERREKAFFRLIGALLAALLITNAAWLYAWLQYDYASEETTTETVIDVDGGDNGVANYIGNDGDIYYGTDNSKESKNDTETQTY